MTPVSLKVGVYRAAMSFAAVFRCSWRRSRGSVVTNEVSGKGNFSFSRKKTCDFHARLYFEAVKLTRGEKKTRYEVDLCS